MKKCAGDVMFNCPRGHYNECDCARTECCLPDEKTNIEHFRAMTDAELVEFLFEHGADTVCDLVCGGGCTAVDSFKETASQKCRKIILAKLREPYKEKEHEKL